LVIVILPLADFLIGTARDQADFGLAKRSMPRPVSTKDFRLERTAGQPCLTPFAGLEAELLLVEGSRGPRPWPVCRCTAAISALFSPLRIDSRGTRASGLREDGARRHRGTQGQDLPDPRVPARRAKSTAGGAVDSQCSGDGSLVPTKRGPSRGRAPGSRAISAARAGACGFVLPILPWVRVIAWLLAARFGTAPQDQSTRAAAWRGVTRSS
jgi:hypothetical protein